jgi:hypothetical protein
MCDHPASYPVVYHSSLLLWDLKRDWDHKYCWWKITPKAVYWYWIVKKFPSLWNLKFIIPIIKAHFRTISWAISIHSTLSHAISVKSILIFSSYRHLCLFKWSLPLWFSSQHFVCIYCFPYACYMSHPSCSSWLSHLNNTRWKVQILKLLIMLFSQSHHFVSLVCELKVILLCIRVICPFLSKCRAVWFWHFDWCNPETMAAGSESISISWLWLTSGCPSQVSNVGWSVDSSWFAHCRSNASTCQRNSPASKSSR